MSQIIMLSGLNGEHLKDALHASLKATKPQVVGIASAFVSTNGVKDFSAILKACGAPQCRLIAGTDKAITHPEALYSARKLGWNTRLGKAPLGIFHPKAAGCRPRNLCRRCDWAIVLRLCWILEPDSGWIAKERRVRPGRQGTRLS